VNEIINATDIDYIEKKDLLSNYVSDLVRITEDNAIKAENLKQDIAKQ
jgi:ribosomal protein S18